MDILTGKRGSSKDSLRVKNSIDFTLYGKQNVSLPRLINILQKDGIDTVIRKNEEGKLYGITYLDHRTRSVFKPLTRKIALRMGIVFGHADGAFPRLLNLVKFGLGGKQGDGEQYMSWIHEQDAAKCTEWLLQHETMNGIINCTSSEPVKNDIFMANLRHIYGIPVGLPAPAWLLEIGAALIGTETELILKSRWVLPKRLLDSGYVFLYPKVEHVMKDILSVKK